MNPAGALDYPRPGLRPISAAQARALDQWAAHHLGMPTLLLMEHAALAVAQVARELAPVGEIWCLCGPGNNGGDGLAAARLLLPRAQVALLRAPAPDQAPAAAIQHQILRAAGVPLASAPEQLSGQPAVVIDALLGTGLTRAVEGECARWIRWLNDQRAPVLAVDLPSGMHADTGATLGVAVQARVTVTFGRPKLGLLTPAGARLAGSVVVASLGIPEPALEAWLRDAAGSA